MTGEQRPKLAVTRVGGIERIHVERADGDMLAATSVVQDQYAHVGQLLTCRFFPTIYLHTMSRVRGRLSWIHVSFYWKHVKYTVSYRIVVHESTGSSRFQNISCSLLQKQEVKVI